MLKKDHQLLLKLARNTLETYFKDSDPDTSGCMHLTQLRGCFVTLHKHKVLRGCIGFPKPIMPLFEQIIAATKAAAFDDSRFDPVIEGELKELEIEISILTRPEPIKVEKSSEYLEKIQIDKDGLIIQHQNSSGLLLPQVATEYSLSPLQFLELLCEKANLSKNSWKEPDCKIYRFRAEIFGE